MQALSRFCNPSHKIADACGAPRQLYPLNTSLDSLIRAVVRTANPTAAKALLHALLSLFK
jgi:hypothetical protein